MICFGLFWHVSWTCVFVYLSTLYLLLYIRPKSLIKRLWNMTRFKRRCHHYLSIIHMYIGQSWRWSTKCDCKTDWLWVRSPLEDMKYLLKFIFPFLRSGVEAKRVLLSSAQHAMSPEFGRNWGTECLNTRFPLPTLLCAGYSVKMIHFFYFICI